MYMEASATAEPSMGKYLPRAEMPRSTCKIRAGKQDYAQTLHYETWGDVLLILRRQVVTVFSHIIRKYNLPFFFFMRYQTSFTKWAIQTDRCRFQECWLPRSTSFDFPEQRLLCVPFILPRDWDGNTGAAYQLHDSTDRWFGESCLTSLDISVSALRSGGDDDRTVSQNEWNDTCKAFSSGSGTQ